MQIASKTKIKKFRIVRIEMTLEFVRPILGRLLFIFVLPRLIKIVKVDLRKIGIQKNVYCLCVPKINYKGVCNEE